MGIQRKLSGVFFYKILDLCRVWVYYMPRYSGIAQSVEHLTVNQGVTGSSPVAGAKINKTVTKVAVFWYPKIFYGSIF